MWAYRCELHFHIVKWWVFYLILSLISVDALSFDYFIERGKIERKFLEWGKIKSLGKERTSKGSGFTGKTRTQSAEELDKHRCVRTTGQGSLWSWGQTYSMGERNHFLFLQSPSFVSICQLCEKSSLFLKPVQETSVSSIVTHAGVWHSTKNCFHLLFSWLSNLHLSNFVCHLPVK